jgi:hypothetical protein
MKWFDEMVILIAVCIASTLPLHNTKCTPI